jgi:predicted metalloprotease
MRWKDYRQSSNVEDRRGMSAGGRGVAIGGGGIVLVLVLSLLTGQNPMVLLDEIPGRRARSARAVGNRGRWARPATRWDSFASTVLASTEDVWSQLIDGYQPPRLVLFSSAVDSACGYATAAAGPFYCPGDSQVYLDLSFFDRAQAALRRAGRLRAGYVIAHEVGHHVQNQLGLYETHCAGATRCVRAAK